ncbi:hypothetical protein CAI21_10545 [Alkalilimnicola ehrlichii]|uniref:fibronectin type III domain-containing protein n=1 Tax=Alkalilimnicola ehrlichii TaxID=351052 RepID=UPI000E2F077C|nr:fibronectin type III domain-containing protein [Alkalilimnicola ehrlichii]RFA29199.1 hypothetical protein CAI21_10545 [Alkalilimnicola ehrlichii]
MMRRVRYPMLAVICGSIVGACATYGGPPSTPGQPQFGIEPGSSDPETFDVNVRWTPPEQGNIARYHYSTGTDSGPRWSDSGVVRSPRAALSEVPPDSDVWFCVRAEDERGQEGGNRCNRFSTPPLAEELREQAKKRPTAVGMPPKRECDDPEPEWIWCDDFEEDRINAYLRHRCRASPAWVSMGLPVLSVVIRRTGRKPVT